MWGSFLPTHVPPAALSPLSLSSQSHQQRGVRQQRTSRFKFLAKLSGPPAAAPAVNMPSPAAPWALQGKNEDELAQGWIKAVGEG